MQVSQEDVRRVAGEDDSASYLGKFWEIQTAELLAIYRIQTLSITTAKGKRDPTGKAVGRRKKDE